MEFGIRVLVRRGKEVEVEGRGEERGGVGVLFHHPLFHSVATSSPLAQKSRVFGGLFFAVCDYEVFMVVLLPSESSNVHIS